MKGGRAMVLLGWSSRRMTRDDELALGDMDNEWDLVTVLSVYGVG